MLVSHTEQRGRWNRGTREMLGSQHSLGTGGRESDLGQRTQRSGKQIFHKSVEVARAPIMKSLGLHLTGSQGRDHIVLTC